MTYDSGAVEYVCGTHATETLYAPKSFHGDGRIANPEFEDLPDIESRRDRLEILSWDLEPGDCAVHHFRTVHGAPANLTASTRRRGLATRWIGDDITFELRPGIPQPMLSSIEALAPHLAVGEPLSGDVFPVVWEANA